MTSPKHPFEYQRPTPEHVTQIEVVRAALKQVHDTVLNTLPPSRERSLAITKLEEASMWANKGIVFNAAVALTAEQQSPAVVTRAKFTVTNVNPDQGTVNFHPVYSADPNSENGQFFVATPNGEITLRLVRAGVLANFTLGEEFYVDFTPAQ